ncbi:Hypothetical protein FKW44_019724 [Caligus rogercresseyi]|uniref:Uncharacterized protein n=1 Tax=Caligus rogercresseyi TaxID=217165 RepID=A0A7T8GW82_CALRO|nr:Hypothetical protein FKW44_019724 [Caligus rogercresseyi]
MAFPSLVTTPNIMAPAGCLVLLMGGGGHRGGSKLGSGRSEHSGLDQRPRTSRR